MARGERAFLLHRKKGAPQMKGARHIGLKNEGRPSRKSGPRFSLFRYALVFTALALLQAL